MPVEPVIPVGPVDPIEPVDPVTPVGPVKSASLIFSRFVDISLLFSSQPNDISSDVLLPTGIFSNQSIVISPDNVNPSVNKLGGISNLINLIRLLLDMPAVYGPKFEYILLLLSSTKFTLSTVISDLVNAPSTSFPNNLIVIVEISTFAPIVVIVSPSTINVYLLLVSSYDSENCFVTPFENIFCSVFSVPFPILNLCWLLLSEFNVPPILISAKAF